MDRRPKFGTLARNAEENDQEILALLIKHPYVENPSLVKR